MAYKWDFPKTSTLKLSAQLDQDGQIIEATDEYPPAMAGTKNINIKGLATPDDDDGTGGRTLQEALQTLFNFRQATLPQITINGDMTYED